MLCCPTGSARTAVAPQRNKRQLVGQVETTRSGIPQSYLLLRQALNAGSDAQQRLPTRGTCKPLTPMQSSRLVSDPDLKAAADASRAGLVPDLHGPSHPLGGCKRVSFHPPACPRSIPTTIGLKSPFHIHGHLYNYVSSCWTQRQPRTGVLPAQHRCMVFPGPSATQNYGHHCSQWDVREH